MDLAMETHFPCLAFSFTNCQICVLAIDPTELPTGWQTVRLTEKVEVIKGLTDWLGTDTFDSSNTAHPPISLSMATHLKQNSERTNSITQHIFCRGNQLESLQRLPPPEAICPHAAVCAAHCTCPFYLCTVTVSCLSILSIILSPSLLSLSHSVPSVQLSLFLYTLFLYISHSLYCISFTGSVFLSLSVLFGSLSSYLQGNMSVLKMGCSDPYGGIQNRVKISPILPLWNMFLINVSTSASLSPEHLLSSIRCFIALAEGRLSVMLTTATQYDAVFNFWTEISHRLSAGSGMYIQSHKDLLRWPQQWIFLKQSSKVHPLVGDCEEFCKILWS